MYAEINMADKIGLLAGRGDLPKRIIDQCVREGRPFHVIAFKGQTDESLVEGHPHDWVRLGAAGTTLSILKEQKVTSILMAGPITRPSMMALRPDAWGLKFLAKTGAGALGDDGFLKSIVKALETEGFSVIGVQDVLSDILAPAGVLGQHHPDEQAQSDLAKAFELAQQIGALDVGQGVVVQDSLTLAVEAIEGTDEMLERCKALKRDAPGGVLVKTKKPEQEKRADLPTIGVRTVRNAHAAGLRGIGVEAGASLIIDLDGVVAEADKLGLFVVGLNHDSQ